MLQRERGRRAACAAYSAPPRCCCSEEVPEGTRRARAAVATGLRHANMPVCCKGSARQEEGETEVAAPHALRIGSIEGSRWLTGSHAHEGSPPSRVPAGGCTA